MVRRGRRVPPVPSAFGAGAADPSRWVEGLHRRMAIALAPAAPLPCLVLTARRPTLCPHNTIHICSACSTDSRRGGEQRNRSRFSSDAERGERE